MNFIDANNIRLIYEDFSDPIIFNKLDNYYDDFYMLASMIGVNFTLKNPHEVIRVNTALIYNSLEWLKKVNIKNVLFTSTSECYSGTIDKFKYVVPTDEKIPLCIDDIKHPRWTYAATKILGESGFLNYAKHIGFNCKIIRYNNIIGPKMGFGHIIPHLVERFLKNETPFLIYGADQTRSFFYIDDGALVTIQAMETEINSNEIFHIGNDDEVTIRDFVMEAGKIMNYKGNYVDAPTYPGSVSRRCPDLNKSKTMLKFNINYSWNEALEKTMKWYIDYFQKNPNFTCFEKPDKYYK